MTPKKKTPGAGRPPSKCPACGRPTSENFTRPKRAGLHCHDTSTEKWATHCGTVLCLCGAAYHAHGFAPALPKSAKP